MTSEAAGTEASASAFNRLSVSGGADTDTVAGTSHPAAVTSTDSPSPRDDDDDKESSKTLAQLYFDAQSRHKRLQESTDAPSKRDAMATQAVTALTRVYKLIRTAALFSSNEEVDDVSTTNLKYVLCPLYLGDTYLLISEPHKRLQNVQTASAFFKKFIEHCQDLKLLKSEVGLSVVQRCVCLWFVRSGTREGRGHVAIL